ncbi:MAG: DUF4147 domain-containing protein [Phycisphaerales bacterium]|nr:MAG: DUF4147 domain-containing protein [Phycisphaerales bacterium]
MMSAWQEELRAVSDRVVREVLEAVEPGWLVERSMRARAEEFVGGTWKVVAFGKASVAMVRGAAKVLGPRLLNGVVVAGDGSFDADVDEVDTGGTPGPRDWRGSLPSTFEVLFADHPRPTARNVDAARRVESFVREVSADEGLLVLVSGGGSAHLTLPMEGVSLDEIAETSSRLMRVGATIREINSVRKHVERLKGGRLAGMCNAAAIEVIVLSDVIGDPLDTIASGPCAPDPTTFAEALGVLTRYRLRDVPMCAGVVRMLERGTRGEVVETPKPGDPRYSRVRHTIVGNNTTALDAARKAVEASGFSVMDVRGGIEGDAATVAQRWVRETLQAKASASGRHAWILGGETTVDVEQSTGRGGPSQEFALAASMEIAGHEGVGVLVFSTDGVDGPTANAGAVIDGGTEDIASASGVDAARGLVNHDSARVLEAAGCVVRTGPTGTNVNHVAVLFRADRRG